MSAMAFPSPKGKNGCEQTRKGRQELIVQINIGRQCQPNEIRLSDINNSNYIDWQIKSFIQQHNLKKAAFAYIREIINKQIARRKDQVYRASHSKCSKTCNCKDKMHRFNAQEKKILGVISLTNNSKNQQKNSKEKPTKALSPQRISIKITSVATNTPNQSRQRSKQNIFKEGLTLVQVQGRLISCNSKDINSSNIKEKELNSNSMHQYFSGKNPEHTMTSDSSLTQSRLPYANTIKVRANKSNKINIEPSNGGRKCKLVSTKQRKQALMTPNKGKLADSSTLEMNLQGKESNKMLNQQFSAYSSKIIQKILESPLFPVKCVPEIFQSVLSSLFMKLTENNPPGTTELLSQYVSYQKLQEKELQLMSLLFEKMDFKDLSKLNYCNFRQNTLKYCWKAVEQLVRQKDPLS